MASMRVLFGFLFLFLECNRSNAEEDMNISPAWTRLEPSLPVESQFRCYALCVSDCMGGNSNGDGDVKATSSLLDCDRKCVKYNRSDLCPPSDKSCWTKCKDFNFTTDSHFAPSPPENLTIDYTLFPEPTPHEADLIWQKQPGVKLYLIKYVELSEKKEPVLKLTVDDRFHFAKPSLCSMYAFSVASVDARSIGRFSDPVILEAPKPIIPTPSYDLISAERIAEPFATAPGDAQFAAQGYNSTVRVLIAFAPPPNWNLSAEITRIDANVLVMSAGTPRLSFSTEPKRVGHLAQFEVRLPGAVADTFAYCKFMFTVEKMFTKCDDQNAVWYPSQVYNPATNQTTPGLRVQLNCQDIKNSGCTYNPTALMPSCGYKDVRTEIHPLDRDNLADVQVHFTPRHDPFDDRPVLYYNITYGEARRGANIQESILFNMTRIVDTLQLENTTRNFTLPHLQRDRTYVVYICSVYDLRASQLPGDWNEFQRYAIDLSSTSSSSSSVDRSLIDQGDRSDRSSKSDLRLAAMIVVPLLVAIVVASLVITLYTSRRRRRAKKDGEFDDAEYHSGEDDRYVTLKRRFDHWELPRRRLQVDQSQKLGAGAFGAVYKGRIEGQLAKNRESVLAEYWMQSENCEVAVKMLPAYADELSKSDFQKEINLMKQLGFHERLVNMLGCVTAADPLCLVVEYCSDGDLLNYLRKRRKYMCELQDNGIDINYINDNSQIDFDLVLCKKDLISYAWQISVGLEYLSERGYIHRDVAARNILVASGKRAKIGDFGLCRYSISDPVYTSKGGRLPIKWMALEAIKNYEFTTKSDVWSYGVLLFEIVTLGGSPYPGVQPNEMEHFLESGQRMEQPESCPYELYEVMLDCWRADPEKRPTFTRLREGMRLMLEHITEDYYYMGLNQSRDYYNAAYQDDKEQHEAEALDQQDQQVQNDQPDSPNPNLEQQREEPPSPTDTISFDDSTSQLENNVFDTESPPATPAPAVDPAPATPVAPSPAPVVVPPLPPRLRRLTSVGGESVCSVDNNVPPTPTPDSPFCSSPALMMAIRRLDSTSSDQALLSPTFFPEKPPKFFKFTPSTKLSPLPELAPAPSTNYLPTTKSSMIDQHRPDRSIDHPGSIGRQDSILDQIVQCEEEEPEEATHHQRPSESSSGPITPITPVSPSGNDLHSLLPWKKK